MDTIGNGVKFWFQDYFFFGMCLFVFVFKRKTNLKKFLIIVPGLSLTLVSDEVAVVVVTTVGLTVVPLIDTNRRRI